MSVEENKRVIEGFIKSLDQGDAEGILGAYAPDVSIWTAGSNWFSGEHDLAEAGELVASILGQFPQGLQFRIEGLTAEGDRVAVEAESQGRHRDGRSYCNKYHFLFVLRDGKIVRMKEYMDTWLAGEFLGREAAPG